MMIRLLTISLLFSCTALFAGEGFDYVGSKNCKMCHNKAEKGSQFDKWSETKHASALESLKGDQALKIAEEKGLEVPPSESGECLSCHSTGYGQGGYEVLSAEFIADEANKRAVKKNEALASVGCEVCHGPGKSYKKKSTMTGIFDGSIAADSVGLIMPNKDACLGCHNENSPTFSGFDFEALSAKIVHPYPEGMRE